MEIFIVFAKQCGTTQLSRTITGSHRTKSARYNTRAPNKDHGAPARSNSNPSSIQSFMTEGVALHLDVWKSVTINCCVSLWAACLWSPWIVWSPWMSLWRANTSRWKNWQLWENWSKKEISWALKDAYLLTQEMPEVELGWKDLPIYLPTIWFLYCTVGAHQVSSPSDSFFAQWWLISVGRDSGLWTISQLSLVQQATYMDFIVNSQAMKLLLPLLFTCMKDRISGHVYLWMDNQTYMYKTG